MTRRTKIVATLGPASSGEDVIGSLIKAGMDVARLNFSHGDQADHRKVAELVRATSAGSEKPVGILIDLPGPKIRSGEISTESIEIEFGRPFVLTGEERIGDDSCVSTSLGGDLVDLVDEGDEILLADGEIVLEVTGIKGSDVLTEVKRGGELRSRKGMHLPSAELKLKAFTDRDARALDVAVAMEADLVAVSFIREGGDMRRVRDALPDKGHRPLLVAKIETRSALSNIEAICQISDAVMVARGDLGIQIPLEQVPVAQKQIISICNATGTPVITATEMLESMVHSPLPTRAEAGDIANAVLDGADALMLSEETAVGSYAIEAVETMVKVVSTAESIASIPDHSDRQRLEGGDEVSWAVASAAVQASMDVGAAAILCPTQTGATARRVATFRPSMPILALASARATVGGLTISWGVRSRLVGSLPEAATIVEECDRAVQAARASGVADSGDLVTVVAGTPGPRAGRTDFMRIVRV